MTTKFSYVAVALIIIASLAAACYVYPLLPEKVASHWNIAGEVDGYMGKFWGVFLLPIISALFAGLFFVLPKIDPLRKNIDGFRREYNLFFVSVVLFLVYMYILTLIWNLGVLFEMGRFVTFGIGFLFILMGYILPRTKRNWFLGIRTPWSLSSDTVWQKTHAVGGKLFIVTGIAAVISSLAFPEQSLFVIVGFAVVSVLWLFVYSYLTYRKEART